MTARGIAKFTTLAALSLTLAAPAFASHHEGHAKAGKDVTRDEYLQQAGQRFDKLDANKDGVLSSAERRAGAKAAAKKKKARAHRAGAAASQATSAASGAK